jgi:hypothetical protein
MPDEVEIGVGASGLMDWEERWLSEVERKSSSQEN